MKHRLEIYADYFQIHIQTKMDDFEIEWNTSQLENLIAQTSSGITIGTVRNMEVPLTIEVFKKRPNINFDEWDQINECSLEVSNNELLISGGSDGIDETKHISISNGTYKALILYKGLSTISMDGLDGDDSYYLYLWKENRTLDTKIKVLKKRN